MALVSRPTCVASSPKDWPTIPTSAQLNLPFCVATLLLEGDVFVDQFPPGCVNDETRIALSRKVEVVHDPEITALGSRFRHTVRVDIHLKDGRILTETREAPQGSEFSFASEEMIVDKFEKLAAKALPPDRVEAVVKAVLGLEVGAAREIPRLMSRQLPLFGVVSALATIVLGGLLIGVAWLVHLPSGFDFPVLILALSPGGFAEMTLTARALTFDIALVTGFHFVRAFCVNSMAGPLWSKGFSKWR